MPFIDVSRLKSSSAQPYGCIRELMCIFQLYCSIIVAPAASQQDYVLQHSLRTMMAETGVNNCRAVKPRRPPDIRHGSFHRCSLSESCRHQEHVYKTCARLNGYQRVLHVYVYNRVCDTTATTRGTCCTHRCVQTV